MTVKGKTVEDQPLITTNIRFLNILS